MVSLVGMLLLRVRCKLPGLIWRIQNRKKRQIIISTHSSDLLSDKGIGDEEVLLLTPDVEGTQVETASSVKDVRPFTACAVIKGLKLDDTKINQNV